jgi:hypothetical protein
MMNLECMQMLVRVQLPVTEGGLSRKAVSIFHQCCVSRKKCTCSKLLAPWTFSFFVACEGRQTEDDTVVDRQVYICTEGEVPVTRLSTIATAMSESKISSLHVSVSKIHFLPQCSHENIVAKEHCTYHNINLAKHVRIMEPCRKA